MSGTDDLPGKRRPPRADPLQPDRPSGGEDVDRPGSDPADVDDATSVERRRKQGEDGRDNVREGYD